MDFRREAFDWLSFRRALGVGRQGHAFPRGQFHPDRIAAANLQCIVLVRLHDVLADFQRAVQIFTQKHGRADLTFKNVFSVRWPFLVQDNAFGAHDYDDIGSLA